MSKAIDGNRRRLQLAAFVSSFDRFTMPPMLVAIAHDLGVPLNQVVSAAGAYFLVYGLMQPVWGILSIRIGLAATMTWCTLAGSAATLSATLVNNVTALAISRGIAGGLFSAAIPAALIYVGETVLQHRRQREVTDLMTGLALGTALSTGVAGVMTFLLGWQWVFALSGCIGILSAIYISRLVELPRKPFRDPLLAPLKRVLTNLAVYRLLALAVLDGAAILGALTFLPTAVESTGHNAATAAGVTATWGIAVLAGARLVGVLSRRITGSTFILVGAATGAIACGILALSIHLVAAVAACVLLGFCWASMHSSLQTWATEVIPEERPIAVSFFAGSLFAGSALAAALGGPLAERHDFTTLFASGTLTLIVVGLAGYLARSRWERHH